MRELHVVVNNKIATYLNRDGDIVCGNSDYVIVFTFDSEWDEYENKTARFFWNDNYIDILFTGDTVAVPVLSKTSLLRVGVYAGELSTTTSAQIPCVFSVLCDSTEGEEASLEYVNGKIEYRLPIPTDDDEGLYLKVVGGVWKAAPLNPVAVEVATEEEMTALLESAEVGSIYKYVGESGTYENGAIYIVEEETE